MGLFASKKPDRTAEAAEWTERANRSEQDAKQARATIARHRRYLEDGSTDPAADRYLIKQAEEDLWVAEANARDYRKTAASLSKRGRY